MSHTRIHRLVFLMLTLFGCSASRTAPAQQSSADAQVFARRILADSNLPLVLGKAKDLLTTGFNAGSGYGEVWIRDLNTFIELSLQVNDPKPIRDAPADLLQVSGTAGRHRGWLHSEGTGQHRLQVPPVTSRAGIACPQEYRGDGSGILPGSGSTEIRRGGRGFFHP